MLVAEARQSRLVQILLEALHEVIPAWVAQQVHHLVYNGADVQAVLPEVVQHVDHGLVGIGRQVPAQLPNIRYCCVSVLLCRLLTVPA